MPRKLRVPSPSGIYHVMLRGINRDDIFLDDIDFLKMEKILRSLAKPVDKEGNPQPPICKIFAYCLMTNHIHLLIAELDESISDTIKRLGVATPVISTSVEAGQGHCLKVVSEVNLSMRPITS